MNPIVEQAKQGLDRGKGRLLTTFAAMPDDKVAYAPAGSAKSAINLLAHCTFANFGMSQIITGEMSGTPDMEEIQAMSRAAEAKVTDRAQAVRELEQSVEATKKVFDSVPESRLSEAGPMGMPISTWMFIIGQHMDSHAAQIDYIQTCYGDLTDHFGG